MLDQITAVAAESASAHNLPRPRNPHFTGRRQVLEAIGRWRTSEPSAGPALAIYGGGGIGKTELAIEYAYANLDNYRLTWWLPAEDPALLNWHFSQLAQKLGVATGMASDSIEARNALLAALAQRNDWLLIFDNAPDAAAIRSFLPAAGQGHVLITSRDSKWHGVARSFCLRVMEWGEATEFLTKRAHRDGDPNAATVAHALGNLPLALEQAAALIDQTGISCGDYLRRFEEYWAELLQSGRSSGEYPDSLAMTWELACRELEEENLDALALLKVVVYLAPAELPLEYLAQVVRSLPAPLSSKLSRATGLDSALSALNRFALVTGNEEAISLHHFVASITRDRLAAEGHENWCKLALEMVQSNFAFDIGTPAKWPESARALPHALTVSAHAQAAKIAPGMNAKLLNSVGEYLQQIGKYEQARTVLERAMVLCEQAYGPDNPRRSAIANNLGRVLKRLGDMNQARAYFEAALGLDEAAYGSSHPHVAEVVNNYGTILYETGDMKTALQQFEFALDVCRAHYGSEHPKVATVVNNVAYVRASNGDLDNALDYFTQALGTAELACGPDHPLVASIRTNLAIALRLKGQSDAARAQLERAVAVSQATLGPGHSDLSRGFGHLGAVHLESGDFATAKRYFQRALDIDERTLGKSHVLLVSRLKDLGRCLKALGDVDGSVTCYERAGQIIRDSRVPV